MSTVSSPAADASHFYRDMPAVPSFADTTARQHRDFPRTLLHEWRVRTNGQVAWGR